MTVRVFAVVDDEADARMVVRSLFSEDDRFSLAMEVGSAEEAIEVIHGLRAAPEDLPDLIVLDHNLDGGMTGLAAAPVLKREASRAKIILFTGADDVRLEAMDEPAVDAYLPKSRPDELLSTARRLLGF